MARWSVGEQGSSLWIKERLGHLTASRMNDALDFSKKGEPSAARRKYMLETIAERMADEAADHFVTRAMEHGIEQEPIARQRYEEVTGNIVQQAGFCVHDTIDYFGCSVDGLVGDSGLIEIKCCTTPVHIEIVLAGTVPEKHKKQMATQLLITGRDWCDFVAFDPRVAEASQLFVRRYVPTKEEFEEIETGAMQFLAEVDLMFDRLTRGE